MGNIIYIYDLAWYITSQYSTQYTAQTIGKAFFSSPIMNFCFTAQEFLGMCGLDLVVTYDNGI